MVLQYSTFYQKYNSSSTPLCEGRLETRKKIISLQGLVDPGTILKMYDADEDDIEIHAAQRKTHRCEPVRRITWKKTICIHKTSESEKATAGSHSVERQTV